MTTARQPPHGGRSGQGEPGFDFQLPLNITVTRQMLPNGIAYVFRDFELGELGRLAVEATPAGETRITSEIAGFPSDPMMQRRREALEPISRVRQFAAENGEVLDRKPIKTRA